MEKRRCSGLGLAEIVGMLLIIAAHYAEHGGYGTIMPDDLGANVFFVQALNMFGWVGYSLLVMVIGYRQHGQKTVDRRKIALLVFDVAFFTLAIPLIMQALGIAQVTLFGLVRAGLTWYVAYYLIFSFFAPYLERLLDLLDKRTYQTLLALIFIFWSVIPTFTFRQIDFSRLDFFIVMYAAGSYIRRYVHGQVRYKNGWNLAACMVICALMLLSVAVFDALAKVTDNSFFLENALYFWQCNMILPVIGSVALFLYFSNLKFTSRPMDYAAGSMLHVLIIHMNGYLRRWVWEDVYPNKAYAASPYLHAPVKILCVFAGCLLISVVYRATMRKWVDGALGKWKFLGGGR